MLIHKAVSTYDLLFEILILESDNVLAVCSCSNDIMCDWVAMYCCAKWILIALPEELVEESRGHYFCITLDTTILFFYLLGRCFSVVLPCATASHPCVYAKCGSCHTYVIFWGSFVAVL